MHKIRLPFLHVFYTISFLILTVCILTNSRLSLYYAFTGLELWYHNMIPTLLPFMILSGTLIRMGLTEGFTTLVYPFVKPLFQVSRNVCYVMIMGFLCGFPMGAKCVSDLYVRGGIDRDEATYLLTFCNNIGPVYFVSFALPVIGCRRLAPCLFGMYGVPLLYGLWLRYTSFRKLSPAGGKTFSVGRGAVESCKACVSPQPRKLLRALDESIQASLWSMLMLGGYMVLFNLLMLLPHMIAGGPARFVAPVLEITGGLKLLENRMPFYSLILLPFGGFSCIAQTYTCIRDTDLSIREYVRHKLILTFLCACYYLLCLRFLRFL